MLIFQVILIYLNTTVLQHVSVSNLNTSMDKTTFKDIMTLLEKLVTSKIHLILSVIFTACEHNILGFCLSSRSRGILPFIFVLPNASFNNFLHFRNCYFVKTGWLHPLKRTKTVTRKH